MARVCSLRPNVWKESVPEPPVDFEKWNQLFNDLFTQDDLVWNQVIDTDSDLETPRDKEERDQRPNLQSIPWLNVLRWLLRTPYFRKRHLISWTPDGKRVVIGCRGLWTMHSPETVKHAPLMKGVHALSMKQHLVRNNMRKYGFVRVGRTTEYTVFEHSAIKRGCDWDTLISLPRKKVRALNVCQERDHVNTTKLASISFSYNK